MNDTLGATARGPFSKLALTSAGLVFVPVLLLVLLSEGSLLGTPWACLLLLATPFAAAHVLFAAGMLLAHVTLFLVRRSGKRGWTLALISVLFAYAVIATVAISFINADLVLG